MEAREREALTEQEFRTQLLNRNTNFDRMENLLKQTGSFVKHPRTCDIIYGVPFENRSQTKFLPRVAYHRTSNRIVKGKGFTTSGNKITMESLKEELDGQSVQYKKLPTWKGVYFTSESRCK
jgi:hypothetical protein